eukprot:Gb_12908 [translate_table: standard]
MDALFAASVFWVISSRSSLAIAFFKSATADSISVLISAGSLSL